MDFKQFIDEVIPPPGMFLLLKQEGNDAPSSKKKNQKFLDIFKQKEKAEKVLEVYAKSHNNSVSLLKEAEVLLETGYYARAVALAIISFEELGKSQIAADFYSGVLPEEEYARAFKSHKKTSFAGRHAAIGTHKNVKYGYWVNDSIAATFERIRQMAIYVDEINDPLDGFTKQDANLIIQKVKGHIEYIEFAEAFNGRIGSKALFK
jgi:AbiV family abortive infection protein